MTSPYPSLLRKELQKSMAYRFDLWLSLFISFPAEILIQGCLWYSIFTSASITRLSGWSLHELLLYIVLIFFVRRVVSSRHLDIATEIYGGGLERYLVMPVNFILAKYMGNLSYSILLLVQFIFGFACVSLLVDFSSLFTFNVPQLLMGLISLSIAQYIYYMVVAAIDLAAFWVGATWSLLLMWRLTIGLFSGAMFPLSFFPEPFLSALKYTPLPYIYAWPLEAFLGRLSFEAWSDGVFVALLWAVFVTFATQKIYKTGLRGYAGVGA